LKTLDLAKARGFAPHDFNGLPPREQAISFAGEASRPQNAFRSW
jgi:hypothetical protein